MAGKANELEIIIKSVLDGRGIQAADAEIKKLAQTMDDAADAGGRINTTAEQIVDGLEKQRSAAAQTKSAWENLSEAQRQDQRELAQRAVRMLEADEAQKRTAQSASGLARQLGALRQAGQGLSNVVNGLSRGDLPGLIQAGKGAAETFKAMQNGLHQFGRGFGIASAAAAPLILAIEGMRKVAEENADAMERMWEEGRKGAEAYAAATEANAQRVEKAHQAEMARIEEMAAAYERLGQQIDAAYARAERLNDAKRDLRDVNIDREEQAALAKATTPEAKEKLRQQFARRRQGNEITDTLAGFETTNNRADVEIRAANEAMAAARARQYEAETTAQQARREFEAAMAGTKAFAADDASPGAMAARAAARLAQDNLTRAESSAGVAATETQKVIEGAQAQIEAANLAKEEAALRRQSYQATIDMAKAAAAAASKAATTPEDRAKANADLAAIKAAEGKFQSGPAAPNPYRDALNAQVKQDAQGPASMTTADGRAVQVHQQRGPGSITTATGEVIKVTGANSVELQQALAQQLAQQAATNKAVITHAQQSAADNKKLEDQMANAAANRTGGG